MLKTTLIPLNLKERDQKLKTLAGFISHFGTETVYLFHVFSGSREAEKKRREAVLREKAELFRDMKISVETIIRPGTIADEICKTAAEVEADYITLLWKKKNIIKRTILSSPDTNLLRICSYPTLIYKEQMVSSGTQQPGTIIYATDCKRADKKVLPYLKSVPFGAKKLYLLHVRQRAPDPETDKKRHQEMTDKLEKLAEACLDNYDSIKKVLLTGFIRSRIAGESRKRDADLLVIGRNDKVRPMDKVLGSTAESLPHQTHCSVLIIA